VSDLLLRSVTAPRLLVFRPLAALRVAAGW
jgi:hypothetical protein